jgi:hypothetical protein
MKIASWYFKSSLMIFILFIAFEAAQAQVSITYSSRGKQYFTMTIQDDWRVNVGSEVDLSQMTEDKTEPARLISAMPNNGMPLWFGMWVPKELKKIKGAKEYMASLGLDLLADVVTTERKFDTLNSMETYYVNGTGKKEGETMDFRAVFFQLSPENVAIAIYIGPPDTTSRHGEELIRMIHSLQPVME